MKIHKKTDADEAEGQISGTTDSEWLEDGHPDPSKMDFWNMVGAISDKGLWDDYICYGYRVEPRRSEVQKPGYAFVFGDLFTIEDVRKKYGGVKWTLSLNRKVGKRQRLVKETQFDIEAAPIWQHHEKPENATAAGSPAGNGAGTAQAVEALGRIAESKPSLDPELGRMFLDTAKALTEARNNGQDDSDQLEKLLRLAKELRPEPAAAQGVTLKDILELVKELRPAQSAATPEGGFFSQMKDFAGAMTTMREMFGGGLASAAANPKTTILDLGMTLINSLPDLLDKGSETLRNAAEFRRAGMAPAEAARPVGASATPINHRQRGPQPVPAVAAAPAADPALAAAAPASANVSETAPAAPRRLTPDEIRVSCQIRVKEVLVDKLYNGALNPKNKAGREAAVYAALTDPEFAQYLAGKFTAAGAGDAAALAEFKSDPVLGVLFTDPEIKLADVMAFAAEYIGYFNPPAPPVAQTEQPAAPAAV